MQDHKAKLHSLNELIGVMDEQMLAPYKQRTAKPTPAVPAAPVSEPAAPADEFDADAKRRLLEMYGKEEFQPAVPPTSVAGVN